VGTDTDNVIPSTSESVTTSETTYIQNNSTKNGGTVAYRISALEQRINNMNFPNGKDKSDNDDSYNQQTIRFSTHTQANDRWGDDISRNKDDTFHLYFQNVNSLGLPKTDKCRTALNSLKANNCDIVGLAETCADWKDKALQHLVRKEARIVAKHMTIAFSDNRTVSDSTYLP
jgi:hypothetical protein